MAQATEQTMIVLTLTQKEAEHLKNVAYNALGNGNAEDDSAEAVYDALNAII